jgi:hypothetical protein
MKLFIFGFGLLIGLVVGGGMVSTSMVADMEAHNCVEITDSGIVWKRDVMEDLFGEKR